MTYDVRILRSILCCVIWLNWVELFPAPHHTGGTSTRYFEVHFFGVQYTNFNNITTAAVYEVYICI